MPYPLYGLLGNQRHSGVTWAWAWRVASWHLDAANRQVEAARARARSCSALAQALRGGWCLDMKSMTGALVARRTGQATMNAYASRRWAKQERGEWTMVWLGQLLEGEEGWPREDSSNGGDPSALVPQTWGERALSCTRGLYPCNDVESGLVETARGEGHTCPHWHVFASEGLTANGVQSGNSVVLLMHEGSVRQNPRC